MKKPKVGSLYCETLYDLNEVFFYYTEINITTLMDLAMKKSSSQSTIERQCTICAGMIRTIFRHKMSPPMSLTRPPVPKVRKVLEYCTEANSNQAIYDTLYELFVDDTRHPTLENKDVTRS